jgi:hypothetical protein
MKPSTMSCVTKCSLIAGLFYTLTASAMAAPIAGTFKSYDEAEKTSCELTLDRHLLFTKITVTIKNDQASFKKSHLISNQKLDASMGQERDVVDIDMGTFKCPSSFNVGNDPCEYTARLEIQEVGGDTTISELSITGRGNSGFSGFSYPPPFSFPFKCENLTRQEP